MINITEKLSSSIVEINEHNELVINNKNKKLYKIDGTKKRINDSLKNKNVIEHFFLSNKVDGSTINILIG
tara:strand:+ start:338 stop:547 length:210 start_codon:yes stop_codon:yes gene_type:complete